MAYCTRCDQAVTPLGQPHATLCKSCGGTAKVRTAGRRIDANRLASALSNLQRRTEAGEEFPDACWRSASAFNVPYEALQAAYDEADRG